MNFYNVTELNPQYNLFGFLAASLNVSVDLTFKYLRSLYKSFCCPMCQSKSIPFYSLLLYAILKGVPEFVSTVTLYVIFNTK